VTDAGAYTIVAIGTLAIYVLLFAVGVSWGLKRGHDARGDKRNLAGGAVLMLGGMFLNLVTIFGTLVAVAGLILVGSAIGSIAGRRLRRLGRDGP